MTGGRAIVLLFALLVCGPACRFAQEQADCKDGNCEPGSGKVPTNVVRQASGIAYPNSSPPPADAAFAEPPRTLADRRKDMVREISLDEVILQALRGNKVIRTQVGTTPGQNPILTNPNNVGTVYDPAIQGTNIGFGSRGVEAALADFDASLTTSMFWGRNETISNSIFGGGGIAPGAESVQETGTFSARLGKTFGTGGSVAFIKEWNYFGTNAGAATLFPSSFSGNARFEFRQPLLAGAGTEFTRIAGPSNPIIGPAITGVSQGVTIARINNDITVADFEANTRNMVHDVVRAYWDLYLAYCLYDAAAVAHKSATESWRIIKDLDELEVQQKFAEPLARDRYYETKTQKDSALTQIYTAEANLRRLLSMPVNDGTILRPSDEPSSANVVVDWTSAVASALTNRVELRKQKWNIKSLELQHRAAESLTRPRLDAIARYQINGFGDQLLAYNDDDGITAQGLRSAYGSLFQGDQTGWSVGFELNVPIGFRQARSQVRNYELRIAKAKKVLEAQEIDISHELAAAMREMARQRRAAENNLNRLIAARKREQIFRENAKGELNPGGDVYDQWLRAQESVAISKRNYCQALVDYNKAVAQFEFTKGELLTSYNIRLAEGGWEPKAHEDALEKAKMRAGGIKRRHARREPEGFAVPYNPHQVAPALPSFGPEVPGHPGIVTPIEPAPGKPKDPNDPYIKPGENGASKPKDNPPPKPIESRLPGRSIEPIPELPAKPAGVEPSGWKQRPAKNPPPEHSSGWRKRRAP